jgi:microcompartment protein CcmL/EutN
MSAHVIGRPSDELLDILLGHGAEPEQAFIGGREQGLKEGDGFEDRVLGEEPTVPEQ